MQELIKILDLVIGENLILQNRNQRGRPVVAEEINAVQPRFSLVTSDSEAVE